MAKDDRRLFAPFPIEMDEHPKIIGLSDAAFRALFEAVFYSRRMLSDGFLDERVVLRRWGLEVASELASNDDMKPTWKRVDGGWQIHDFEKHHPTKAEILEKSADLSAKRSRAGRNGAAKRWQADSKAMANDSSETETETYRNPPNPPAGGKRNRGTRLNPDWLPTREDVQAVAEQCPGFDTQREHLAFVDYWLAVPGAKGLKLDWSRTWRSWMRRAYDRLPAAERRGSRKVKRFNDEDD
ncbi:MAG: hypothetical protein D3X82_13960 [Candidatus Leucobacter sulfamidivorax]|nr:hypothetical protein [Candidatus Leucobacter sulfamidivorax]